MVAVPDRVPLDGEKKAKYDYQCQLVIDFRGNDKKAQAKAWNEIDIMIKAIAWRYMSRLGLDEVTMEDFYVRRIADIALKAVSKYCTDHTSKATLNTWLVTHIRPKIISTGHYRNRLEGTHEQRRRSVLLDGGGADGYIPFHDLIGSDEPDPETSLGNDIKKTRNKMLLAILGCLAVNQYHADEIAKNGWLVGKNNREISEAMSLTSERVRQIRVVIQKEIRAILNEIADFDPEDVNIDNINQVWVRGVFRGYFESFDSSVVMERMRSLGLTIHDGVLKFDRMTLSGFGVAIFKKTDGSYAIGYDVLSKDEKVYDNLGDYIKSRMPEGYYSEDVLNYAIEDKREVNLTQEDLIIMARRRENIDNIKRHFRTDWTEGRWNVQTSIKEFCEPWFVYEGNDMKGGKWILKKLGHDNVRADDIKLFFRGVLGDDTVVQIGKNLSDINTEEINIAAELAKPANQNKLLSIDGVIRDNDVIFVPEDVMVNTVIRSCKMKIGLKEIHINTIIRENGSRINKQGFKDIAKLVFPDCRIRFYKRGLLPTQVIDGLKSEYNRNLIKTVKDSNTKKRELSYKDFRGIKFKIGDIEVGIDGILKSLERERNIESIAYVISLIPN